MASQRVAGMAIELLGVFGLPISISIGIGGICVFNELAFGAAIALVLPMLSRHMPMANQGGSISLQVVGQSHRNVATEQGMAECRLASADSVARLLASLRGFVQVATVRANGRVERRYLAGERVWQIRSKA